jgi:hypothetical protein
MILAAALAFGLAGGIVSASATEVQNGDFSQGMSSWSSLFGAGGVLDERGVVDRSKSFLGGILYQAISLDEGDYVLKFDAEKSGGLASLSVGLVTSTAKSFLDFFRDSTVLGSTRGNSVSVGDGSAASNSISFTLTKSFTGWLAFVGEVTSFKKNTLTVDNVSVTMNKSTQVPGPVAGAGFPALLVAAGLAMLARRKAA